MSRRQQLINAVLQQGGLDDWESPAPVVSLEQFFEGNTDEGSIGCNLGEHPGIETFFEVLKGIRDRAEVQDVIVEVSEVEPDDASMWPFAERVYILTSASTSEVARWVEDLEPSEVAAGWALGAPDAAPELADGVAVVSVWWD